MNTTTDTPDEQNEQNEQNTQKDEDAQSKDNFILIGMPGSGKSTLGLLVARILNYDFVDADLLLQQQKNKTLERIIEALGPEGFLEVENELLCNLKLDHTILATGGSAIYSEKAMNHLREMGPAVYLQIDYEEIVKRLTDLPERGVIRRGGVDMGLRDLYKEREMLYELYADITIDVNGLTVTDAAHKVAKALQQ